MEPYSRNITQESSFLNMMIDNVISDIHPSRLEPNVNHIINIPETFIESPRASGNFTSDLSDWPMPIVRPSVQSPISTHDRLRRRVRLRPLSVSESLLRINRLNRQPILYPRQTLVNIQNDLRSFIEDTVFRQDTARAILASQSEEVKMRPADDKTISNIKETKFMGCNGSTCTVCLEDLKRGDMMKELSCKHQFHSGCIDEWLKRGDARCPNCNKRID